MEHCPNCGKDYAKYPLKDANGKPIIKNWFKIDFMSILFILCIILLIIGYKADMAKCDDAIKKPCEFCKKSNCCLLGEVRGDTNDAGAEYNINTFLHPSTSD